MKKELLEELLAGQIRELIALGWTKEEAEADEDTFLQVIGKTYTDGLMRDDVMIVFNNVLEQVSDEMTGGIPYWFDPDGITLYKKTFDGNEEIWSGSYEAAGTFEGDPDWQEKLDSFFEKELGIKADEWEVG